MLIKMQGELILNFLKSFVNVSVQYIDTGSNTFTVTISFAKNRRRREKNILMAPEG